MNTVIAGCTRCHRLLCRGADGDPWREVRRSGLLLPAAAVQCPARGDGGAHEVPGLLASPGGGREDDTTERTGS